MKSRVGKSANPNDGVNVYGRQDIDMWRDEIAHLRDLRDGNDDVDFMVWSRLRRLQVGSLQDAEKKYISSWKNSGEVNPTQNIETALVLMDGILPGAHVDIQRTTYHALCSSIQIHGAWNWSPYRGETSIQRAKSDPTALAITSLAIGIRLELDNPSFRFDPEADEMREAVDNFHSTMEI